MRRLQSDSTLKSLYEDWLLAEGPRDILISGWEERYSGRLWRRMVLDARINSFESVNDPQVIEFYQKRDQDRLEADRKAKAAAREKARRVGHLDAEHEADLIAAMCRRARKVVAAINEARTTDSSRWLSRLPSTSVSDMFDVWLGRETLRAHQIKPTPAAITRWIIKTGKRNESANQHALAIRVRRDLDRIAEFEGRNWNGEPLLLPFDPSTEFTR